MLERRMQEVELLRKQYGVIEYGPNLEWILFKEFRLPVGWNKDIIELLVIIPAGYPTTPPNNFYVVVGLRLANGTQPNAYSEPVTHLGRQWGQFSYHIDGEWRPASNLLEGDNLLSFMLKVLERLKELN